LRQIDRYLNETRLSVHEGWSPHRARDITRLANGEHVWQCECGTTLVTEKGPEKYRDPHALTHLDPKR
jgi:hypothetical protein